MADISRRIKYLPRKRKLQDEFVSLKGKKKVMPDRYGRPRKEDWNKCMEGFEGLDLPKEPSKIGTNEQGSSQLDIDWNSDDEDQRRDVQPSDSTDSQTFSISSIESPAKTLETVGSSATKVQKLNVPMETQSMKSRKLAAKGTKKGRKYSVSKQRQYYIHENLAGKNVMISDESEGEHIDSPVPTQQATNDEASDDDHHVDEDIIGCSLSLTPENSSTVKASDWLKDVQLKTPPKMKEHSSENDHLFESGKKKPKYLRDGLAERMQKIISREKSNFAVWRHKKNSKSNEKSLRVKVLKVNEESNLFSASCECVSAASDSGLNEQIVLTVILSKAFIDVVYPGDVLKIYPPWQRLKLKSGKQSILCTQFTQLEKRGKKCETKKDETVPLNSCWMKWECPCALYKSMYPRECPAILTSCACAPEHTALTQVCPDPIIPGSPSIHLFTVFDTAREENRNILSAIEKQGGFTPDNISFVAIVQRVFLSKCLKTSSMRLSQSPLQKTEANVADFQVSLLLQDEKGDICHLQIPDRLQKIAPWKSLHESGEGKLYRFCGLRVLKRLTKAREKAFFSVVYSVWQSHEASGKQKEESQTDDSQVSLNPPPQPPAFCYRLTAPPGDSQCQTVSDEGYLTHRKMCLQALSAAKDGDEAARSSFAGRVVYSQECTSRVTCLYLYDSSLVSERKSPLCINISTSCYISTKVAKAISELGSLIILDVFKHNGKFIVDEYSKIDTADVNSNINIDASLNYNAFPSFTEQSQCDDLVLIKGVVTDVDESTAFSWIVCDVCDNDKLLPANSKQPFLYCDLCNKNVMAPRTRLKLDVFLQVSSIDTPLRVALLQSTIEKILPPCAEDEGYEIESVLQKSIGPITCIVKTKIPPVITECLLK